MSVSRLTVAPGCLKPSVVTSSVCGIRATLKRSAATSTTVRLTPSTATDPLATICAASSGGQANQTVSQSPCGSRSATRPTPSTWPWTMWPPSRSPTRNERSRLIRSPAWSSPRLVRRSVSGPAWKEQVRAVRPTTVRQQPLTATLSPTASSPAKGAARTSRQPSASASTRSTVPRASTSPVNMTSGYRDVGPVARPSGDRPRLHPDRLADQLHRLLGLGAGLLGALAEDVLDVTGVPGQLLPLLPGRGEIFLDLAQQQLLRLAVADASRPVARLQLRRLLRRRDQLVQGHHGAIRRIERLAQRRAVGLDAHDRLFQGVALGEDLDGVAVRLAHLLPVGARDRRRHVQPLHRHREDLDAVGVVEVAGHVARHLQVLHLVLAHRHDVRA